MAILCIAILLKEDSGIVMVHQNQSIKKIVDPYISRKQLVRREEHQLTFHNILLAAPQTLPKHTPEKCKEVQVKLGSGVQYVRQRRALRWLEI